MGDNNEKTSEVFVQSSPSNVYRNNRRAATFKDG